MRTNTKYRAGVCMADEPAFRLARHPASSFFHQMILQFHGRFKTRQRTDEGVNA